MNSNLPAYVLITPARNEEAFIDVTIKSVIDQSIRPVRWIVVSDGSTDRTDEIVTRYAAEHSWIELARMPERSERDFAGKVGCINLAYERLKSLRFDLIGNLDADISVQREHYEFLLGKFVENPTLGIAGAPFSEGSSTYNFRFSSVEHVSGACQLFRRECYETIGGYMPLKGGGIDVVAVLSARMKGWQTRTFVELTCTHHRPMGTAKTRYLLTGFRLGQKDYVLGRGPLWQIFRSIYQMTRKPLFIGGSTLLMGYLWAALKRTERPIPKELIEFQRTEQMQRLKRFVFKPRNTGDPSQNVKVSL